MIHKEDELNRLGFEGDTYLHTEVKRLIELHKVKTVIETGTFYGNTTMAFCDMVPKVVTIEAKPQYYDISLNKFLKAGVKVYSLFGKSEDILSQALRIADQPVLFYLDAHWENHCPLLDELRIIAEHNIKPVIVIHDFQVPGRADLGYDSYKGQPLNIQWIESALKSIYGDKLNYHYNEKATGHKRGVIFIEPNY